jgi:hypothetical protein
MHYDAGTKTLRIIYLSGAVYDYKNVPEEIYKDIKAAASKGTFLNRDIKGHFPFKKIK